MPVRKKAKAKTTVIKKDRGEIVSEKATEEEVGEVESSNPLANVGLSMKKTTNIGSFESVGVEVSLHVPCEVEEVDDAFDQVETWVTDKLNSVLGHLGLLDEEEED